MPLEFTQLPSLCSPDRAGINVELDALSPTSTIERSTHTFRRQFILLIKMPKAVEKAAILGMLALTLTAAKDT